MPAATMAAGQRQFPTIQQVAVDAGPPATVQARVRAAVSAAAG